MSKPEARQLAFVLGWPVEHSKSPAMHNAAFAELGIDAEYKALAVEGKDLERVVAKLRAEKTLGASVTVPHKTAVMKLCDSLSDSARAIGAVNTLEFTSDGSIRGHNTDAPGFVKALQDASGEELRGKRALLLGGGGAARAVAYGLKEAGVTDLEVIVRTPSKVEWTSAQSWDEATLRRCMAGCELLVDCTSMGLDPEREAQIPARIPLEQMAEGGIVSTLVYHRETHLLAQARGLGLRSVDGSGMLLFQGVVAFEIWTGQPAPVEVMRQALL